MPWNIAPNSTLEQGQWADWFSLWNNGPDLWDATHMTRKNHRWTKVGGCLYAHGKIELKSYSNFGNGTDIWVLWLPIAWGGFVDNRSGGRIIGDGYAAGNYRGLHFQVQMVNTFQGFAVMTAVEPTSGGTFNNGADNVYNLNRSKLYWLSSEGASDVSIYFQLCFITDPNG